MFWECVTRLWIFGWHLQCVVWSGFVEWCALIVNWLSEHISESALIAIPAITVAILLPMAIFLADRAEVRYAFDKNVIFRKILLFKILIPTVLLVSLILLINYKPLSLLVVGILLVEAICVLVRTYRWFCSYDELGNVANYRQKLRLDFLNGLKSQKELLETWELIFLDKDLAHENQVGLVDAFIGAVRRIKDDKYGTAKSMLLRQLNANLEKINFYDLEVFRRLVRFAGDYYRQEREHMENDDILMSPYELRNLLMNLMHKAFEEKGYAKVLDYIFFDEMGKVLQESSADTRDFMRDLFEGLEKSSVDIFHLWQQHGFFSKLVVTERKLNDEQSGEFTRRVFEAYLEYMMNSLMRVGELDKRKIQVLEKTTELILREVDLRLWFNLMSFCYMGSWGMMEGESVMYSRIVAWCKTKTVIGMLGRSRIFSVSDDIDVEQKMRELDCIEQKEAVHLAVKVQAWLLKQQELQNILDVIRDVDQSEDWRKLDDYEYMRLMCLRESIEKVGKVLGLSLEV